MNLAHKVHCVLLHDHLVHGSPDQHRTLCRRREGLQHVQCVILKAGDPVPALLASPHSGDSLCMKASDIYKKNLTTPKVITITDLPSFYDIATLCLEGLTINHQLCRIAVPLSNHIHPHTNIHASVTLPGMGDHQFAPMHLKNTEEISLQGTLAEDSYQGLQ